MFKQELCLSLKSYYIQIDFDNHGCEHVFVLSAYHDDVIKWKHFPLLALCEGNSPVTGEFPSQKPVTRSFDDLYI